MTRRFWTLAAIGVATFAVIAAAIWFFAWRPVRFVDRARGFSIRFSPEWEILGEGEGAVVRAVRTMGVAQGGGTGVLNVFVSPVANIANAEAYRELFIESVASKFKGFARVQEGIRAGPGVQAPWILYINRRESDDLRVQVCQYFFVRGSRGYVITCTAAPVHFESFRADFEEAVDSFTLE